MNTEKLEARFRRLLQDHSSDGMLTSNIDEIANSLVHEVEIEQHISGPNPEAGSDGQTMHYGRADDPYEVIKIIEHFKLGFHLGNAVKYILRSPKSGKEKRDLEKGAWYVNRHIQRFLSGDAS